MAFLIATEDTNVEVGKDVEILFTGIYPYPNEMEVFVNGVQKTNGISYNYTSQGMVRSFTISFSESGTYDVYVIYDDTILLQHSNTLTFTTKDNKTNIILNHKEVQFIQLTDGGVIYQRPILNQIGSFTVSLSNDIISSSDNESSTITATVLDNNNNPISHEFILFKIDNEEYIDTFTDENGEASIIYEAKGWGNIKITISCRNLTETYTIHDFTYIVDTIEKLSTALTNATTDNSIYLKDGTYSLPSNYTVSGIKLIGESTNAKIVSSNGQINFTDSIIDTIGIETANVNRPVIYVTGTTTVRNCDCVSNVKPWDATVISVNLNNPDGLITIHDCYFHGDARSNGYGHSCSAITGQGSVAYNVIIHHNTFNHPCNSNQLHGSNKGKAVCFYNGNNTTGTLNNVHLYCNEYLGCGDTNVRVSEETCPDN